MVSLHELPLVSGRREFGLCWAVSKKSASFANPLFPFLLPPHFSLCMVAFADSVRSYIDSVSQKGLQATVESSAETAKANLEKVKDAATTNH